MNLVTIYRAFQSADAQLVRSRLEAAGFLAQVTHEVASIVMDGYSMATGGILVQVPEDQAAEARALLDADEGQAPVPPPAE
ncbi:MAG TPA: DUF2007 domain-containing protein [Verrucomicrobiae bacterium]|nr:DUF2007 domain-containing protein [Verrucomicrobiae bacterium]